MSLTKDEMRLLFRNLVRADHFDKMFMSRIMQGKLVGFYHPGDGAMGAGVGASSFLQEGDLFNPHHRGHGVAYFAGRGIPINTYLAEHSGKIGGCCKGRSSFHFSYPEYGLYGTSGFIGANFSPAVGWGWSAKRRGAIVMHSMGDGAYNQGRAHESMLFAANWKLPIIYMCENNGMAIHSEAKSMHPTADISSLASGYGFPAVIVDGQDVFAVGEAMKAAIEYCRSGKGPIFLEAKTMRFREHDVGTPDLADSKPRDPEFLAEQRKRDPLVLATKRVLDEKLLTQEEIDELHAAATAECDEAIKFSDASPTALNSEEELLAGVFAS